MSRIYDSVDQLSRALSFHRDRHTVLASNVTHVDTPGYRPSDLRRTDAGLPMALTTTHPAHLGGGGPGSEPERFDDGGALAGPDGNAVTLERELAKIDANRVRFGTSAELVTRRFALLRYAAGDGRG